MRGCQARCTLNTRGAHEANCPFQLALCGLPGPGHKERCHELFTKHDIVKHREECSFRLVPCENTGECPPAPTFPLAPAPPLPGPRRRCRAGTGCPG